MKKLLIIILSLVSTGAFAQQLVETKNVKFCISKPLVKATKKANNNTVQKENTAQKIFGTDALKEKQFTSDGLIKLLQYNDTSYIVSKNYLINKQKIFNRTSKIDGGKVAGYLSKIIAFSDYGALLIRFEKDDYMMYSIYSVNKQYNKLFNIILIALKQDSIAADKEVDNFIKSIKFK